MKALRIVLATLTISIFATSCKKEAKRDTTEKFISEFKAAQAKGIDEVMKLVYKKDQIPEKFLKIAKESLKSDDSLKVKSITTKKFDDKDYDKNVEMLKKAKMKLPVKPTHNLVIEYEPTDKVTDAKSEYTIAKVEGQFYIIAPIKAE